MGYSDNASRHQGVDREARYFSSLLGRRESLSEAKTLLQKVYFYRLTEKDVSTARRL